MNPTKIISVLRAMKNQKWLGLKLLNQLAKDGPQTVTQLQIKTQSLQSEVSLALRELRPLVQSEKNGDHTVTYSLNDNLYPVFMVMVHDLGGTKIDKLEDFKSQQRAATKALEIFKARFWQTKNAVREKIFTFICENPGTPVGPIYGTLDIEQSWCTQQVRLLEKAGWVISEPAGKQRLKFPKLDLVAQVDDHLLNLEA